MNPFATRAQNRPQFIKEAWVLPVTGMCLVLGFMIATAWVSAANRRTRYSQLGPQQVGRVSESIIDPEAYHQLTAQVNQLQAEKTELENAMAGQSSQTKVLNNSLQDTKAFAGLTPLEGPGVTVTLKDSSKPGVQFNGSTVFTDDTNIHDLDLLRVVNELFNAGAEAIAVNKERIVGISNIRCVGTTIMANDVKIAPPIAVRAIGDPQTLMGALSINGGVISEIRSQDPTMVEISEVKQMELPAYTGRTSFKLAKVVKEDKENK